MNCAGAALILRRNGKVDDGIVDGVGALVTSGEAAVDGPLNGGREAHRGASQLQAQFPALADDAAAENTTGA